jgi:hypothetical protein
MVTTPSALHPAKKTSVPFELEAPEPVWTFWITEESLAPTCTGTSDHPARSTVRIPTILFPVPILIKFPNTKSHSNPSSASRVVARRRKDRRNESTKRRFVTLRRYLKTHKVIFVTSLCKTLIVFRHFRETGLSIYTVRSKSSWTKAKKKKIVSSFKIGSIRCNTQVSTCFQLLCGVRKVFCGNLF